MALVDFVGNILIKPANHCGIFRVRGMEKVVVSAVERHDQGVYTRFTSIDPWQYSRVFLSKFFKPAFLLFGNRYFPISRKQAGTTRQYQPE